MQAQVTWPKQQILTVQNGGQLPFKDSFLSVLLMINKSSDIDEIWCAAMYFDPDIYLTPASLT